MFAAIELTRGVAGQIMVSADTPDGRLAFVGNRDGGPVVMIMPSGTQTFVTDPSRFGDFAADPKAWMRALLDA